MLTACALLTAPSGCWSPDPPLYQSPKKTPPVLDLNGATPHVTEIVEAVVEVTLSFNVPVQSEDDGDELVGLLFLNYGTKNEVLLRTMSVDASVFEDEERSFAFPVTLQNVGCSKLVLFVTHSDNFDESSKPPRDPKDVAAAPWWVRTRSGELDPPPVCSDWTDK